MLAYPKFRLTREELASRWADLTRERVNKACDDFREKLARLGIEGKTIRISLVVDSQGNYYYDVRSEAGGRKHDPSDVLPAGSLKVLSLRD